MSVDLIAGCSCTRLMKSDLQDGSAVEPKTLSSHVVHGLASDIQTLEARCQFLENPHANVLETLSLPIYTDYRIHSCSDEFS